MGVASIEVIELHLGLVVCWVVVLIPMPLMIIPISAPIMQSSLYRVLIIYRGIFIIALSTPTVTEGPRVVSLSTTPSIKHLMVTLILSSWFLP